MRRVRRVRFQNSDAKIRMVKVVLDGRVISQQQSKGSTTSCEIELHSNCIVELWDDGVLIGRGKCDRQIPNNELHLPPLDRHAPVKSAPTVDPASSAKTPPAAKAIVVPETVVATSTVTAAPAATETAAPAATETAAPAATETAAPAATIV